MIQQESKTDWREMYQVFNMGHRLEIYTNPTAANELIDIIRTFDIDAQIIGYVENNEGNLVDLRSPYGNFMYS
jgi:phosphoribosylformylglycinamidine cyclo-ligase